MMQRRKFITILGGAAAAWPIVAWAQQAAMPVVGYLNSGSPEPNAKRPASFRKGLSEMGFVEGRNISIEYRWAENRFNRLPELAADLARRAVAVIVAPGSPASALAAKAATTSIPIVFMGSPDPVQIGLVSNFRRPGGNVTGIATMGGEIIGKVLGLLHELVPNATRFAALVNPNAPVSEAVITGLRAAASVINSEIEFLHAATVGEIDEAFTKLAHNRTDALLVSPGSFFASRRVQFATLAARHRVPVAYPEREFAEVGGLMSYGSNSADASRQVGLYVGRILKGERPADLPVMQPTKFEFVINLQTARTLGLTVSPTLLALADEVIE
jgi:putative tryptophan/tyrosine transport system substrate-binding protein